MLNMIPEKRDRGFKLFPVEGACYSKIDTDPSWTTKTSHTNLTKLMHCLDNKSTLQWSFTILL